jgi:hypothetical protein
VKIAVVTHYFWPEMGAPSARLLEMGRTWAAAGHEVSVVTNFPNHPSGIVPEAYRGRSFMVEEAHGLRIVRCRTYATPNRGITKRTLGHVVFTTQAVLQGTPAVRGADVIVASSPTLFSVVAAWAMAWRLRIPFVFEVRDLWPAIFVDLGVLKNRWLIRSLEMLEMFLYRRSGAVVTVTEGFARDIAGRGIAAGKIQVIPNGVDLEAFVPGPPDRDLLARLGLLGKFVVLYCGAHGISHALGRILEAAARLGEEKRFHFLFVGDGAEKDDLVRQAERMALRNVTFLPGVPRAEVPALYRSADVCLVPLRNVPLFRTFIPSKMFEILACGRPIVASVEGEPAEILGASGAALVAPPEDVEGIVGAIARLAADDDLRTSLAGKGRDFVAARYDRRRLAERYLGVLEALHARRACLDPIPSGRT